MGLLRILLALSVLFTHSRSVDHLRWVGGDLAVEMFFVVSGFYMQLILSSKYTRATLGGAWVRQFYMARYFRLFPTYAVACLLVVGISLVWHDLPPLPIWREAAGLNNTPSNVAFKAFLCFTNLSVFFQEITTFVAIRAGSIHWWANFRDSDLPLWQGLLIPQGWSLGIELSFYSVAPWLLNLRTGKLTMVAVLGLAGKFALIGKLHLADPWTYRFFPFELGYFLLGALAYRHRGRLNRIIASRFDRFLVYGLAIGLTTFRPPAFLPVILYPLALACALPFMFRVTAGFATDRLLGELSYPFYVFHALVLETVIGFRNPWGYPYTVTQVWAAVAATLALSAACVALEYRFVEPWRSRFAERKRPVPHPADAKLIAR